jgi:hypothetical protein
MAKKKKTNVVVIYNRNSNGVYETIKNKVKLTSQSYTSRLAKANF